MNGNDIFLDTNILIYLLQGNEEVANIINDKHFVISFITELELLSYPTQSKEEEKAINKLLQECYIVDINAEIKRKTVSIRLNNKVKLPDAIICATASFINIPILTADKKLATIKDLDVVILEAE